jgi:hypothetical protein
MSNGGHHPETDKPGTKGEQKRTEIKENKGEVSDSKAVKPSAK